MRKDAIKAKKVLAQHYDVDNKMDEYAITQAMKSYAQSQTQELQEQNAEIVEMLKDVKGYLGSDKRNEVDALLTKYTHLNKKP